MKNDENMMEIRDNLLRKEGFINGENAIARLIENNLSRLAKLNGKQCCNVLIETIREQTEEHFNQLENEATELNKKIEQEQPK